MSKIDFWSQAHVTILRDFLRVLIDPKHGLSEESVCQFLRQTEVAPSLIPSARALRDFVAPKPRTPRKHERLSVLLRWAVAYARHHVKNLRNNPQFQTAAALLEQLDQVQQRGHQRPEHETTAILAAIKIASAQLHIMDADLERLQSRLFRKEDFHSDRGCSERYFIGYRYHSAGGQIVKSHLTLTGPDRGLPNVCRFVSRFQGSTGGSRRANGIVLPMHNVTYFVGEVDEGAGLKIMAMRDLSTARTRFEGLILSLDDDLSPVAARIVLLPTDIADSHEAEVGIKDENALSDELKPFRPMLMNRIDFSLTENLLFDGKSINQQEMVVKVGEILKDPSTGHARLTDSSGKEFNPAATRHYTFNAALPMWSARAKT